MQRDELVVTRPEQARALQNAAMFTAQADAYKAEQEA